MCRFAAPLAFNFMAAVAMPEVTGSDQPVRRSYQAARIPLDSKRLLTKQPLAVARLAEAPLARPPPAW